MACPGTPYNLIIQNKIVAEQFRREFNRLYNDAKLGLPEKVQSKIARQKNECS